MTDKNKSFSGRKYFSTYVKIQDFASIVFNITANIQEHNRFRTEFYFRFCSGLHASEMDLVHKRQPFVSISVPVFLFLLGFIPVAT